MSADSKTGLQLRSLIKKSGDLEISLVNVPTPEEAPVITAKVPEAAMSAMSGRLDESMPVGNEGAGVVIKTGSSDAAKALMGRTVAMIGGAMYSQYRCLRVNECLP